MTPARWRQIHEAFDGAWDLGEVERQAYLDELGASDPALRDEVESLLRSAETSGPFDQLVSSLPSADASTFDDDLEPGTHIGAYRILTKIGQGGMGVVYSAERADGQFEQRVALKLVKSAGGSAPLMRRFLNERRILARLVHPNIAHLYDGGVLHPGNDVGDEGRPYFVMEYVEGLPVDTYCNVHRLDVDARLNLFCRIGETVQFAHRNMVVHLDLKPSNVMISATGEVKLLDFGVAMLLETTAQSGSTGASINPAGAATPGYAAPEQIDGGSITAATDVYSLGVILHELLTGRRPLRRDAFAQKRSNGRVLPAVPARPSTLVRHSAKACIEGPSPEEIARERGSLPEKLRRRLDGDLDAIVLKALQPNPDDRYGSAEQFVEDIRRHLASLPVNARPGTPAYRAGRFIRRHRPSVAAAVLIAASLVAGIAGTTWQAHIAGTERDHAHQAEAKSRQVSAFLIDLFKVADPSEVRGETVTARELLSRGAARVESELSGQPAVQAEMMTVMGEVYLSLGLLTEARPLFERALDMRRSAYDGAHPEVAAGLHHLASLDYAEGEFESGERRFRGALDMRRKLLDHAHPDLAATLHGLGVLLSDAGILDEAEVLLKEAVDIRRRMEGVSRGDLAESLNGLALVLHRKGDFKEAESLFREAVGAGRRSTEELTPVAISSQRSLARLIHHFDRDYDEAEQMYREALRMSRRLYGDVHPEVAVSLSDLAQVLRDRGDYDAAEPVAREGLAMWRSIYGEKHTEVAISMDILARLLWLKGDAGEAETMYRQTLAMRRELLGEPHPRVIGGLQNLAALLKELGRFDEARQLYEDAFVQANALYSEEHAYVAQSLHGLASIKQAEGDHAGAETYLRQALDIRKRIHDDGHWRIADAKSALAACLTVLGHYEEAERLLLESYPVLASERGASDRATVRALDHILQLYQASDKPEALAHYRALRSASTNR